MSSRSIEQELKRQLGDKLSLRRELERRTEIRAINLAVPVGKLFERLSEVCPGCSPDAVLAAAVELDGRHSAP